MEDQRIRMGRISRFRLATNGFDMLGDGDSRSDKLQIGPRKPHRDQRIRSPSVQSTLPYT